MINDNCSTDFYDECIEDEFPYKVIWNSSAPTISICDTNMFVSGSLRQTYKDEPINNRFDILDIDESCIQYNNLTTNKIQRRLNKIKKEINTGNIWKNITLENTHMPLSEDYLAECIERDIKEILLDTVSELIENKKRSERFEILDLRL